MPRARSASPSEPGRPPEFDAAVSLNRIKLAAEGYTLKPIPGAPPSPAPAPPRSYGAIFPYTPGRRARLPPPPGRRPRLSRAGSAPRFFPEPGVCADRIAQPQPGHGPALGEAVQNAEAVIFSQKLAQENSFPPSASSRKHSSTASQMPRSKSLTASGSRCSSRPVGLDGLQRNTICAFFARSKKPSASSRKSSLSRSSKNRPHSPPTGALSRTPKTQAPADRPAQASPPAPAQRSRPPPRFRRQTTGQEGRNIPPAASGAAAFRIGYRCAVKSASEARSLAAAGSPMGFTLIEKSSRISSPHRYLPVSVVHFVISPSSYIQKTINRTAANTAAARKYAPDSSRFARTMSSSSTGRRASPI